MVCSYEKLPLHCHRMPFDNRGNSVVDMNEETAMILMLLGAVVALFIMTVVLP